MADRVIEPQPGYQLLAMSSPADIVIGGAAAGVGKTYVLLLEDLRHIDIPGFGSVTFRRTQPQIRATGGLWDTSMEIYPFVNGKPRETFLEWEFPSGATSKFASLQYEKDIHNWQGAQIPLLKFDELTHFTKKQFFYMLSRNRSTCGIRPYVRCTCNPDPESWVAEFISWWIDPETGYPIPEREGVVRYFIRYGEDYIWGDTYDEVIDKAWFFLEKIVTKSGQPATDFVKSVTFISGTIYDNQALLTKDPSYLANLVSQDEQTRLQLLDGNWKVVLSDLDIYDYPAFCGLFNNSYSVDTSGTYLVGDIAMLGSDKLIWGVFRGFELADISVVAKSDGKRVVEEALRLMDIHRIQNHHVTFDADGVGSFIDGYIKGAIPFHNGGIPLPHPEFPQKDPKTKKPLPENYENLKAQCYYRSAANVLAGNYRVSEEVANRMYNDKMTVRQRFMFERKAIKRGKPDSDGKLCLIPKAEMKVALGGESPDLMDMFAMREIFNLKPRKKLILV